MKRLFLAAAAVTLLGSLSLADFTRGSQTVAVFGGLGGSSSEYDYQPGNQRPVTGGGGAFGGQYLYYLNDSPALALGADISSSLNSNRRSGDLLSGNESTARTKSLVGMIIEKLAFPRGTWRPYIFAGVGVHNSTQQLSASPQPGNTWPGSGTESRMLVDQNKTSAALGYGIGTDIFPSDSFFFGLELRGTWLAGLDTDDNAALRAAGFNAHDAQNVTQGNLFLRAGVKF
jgi:opacity protein-like surface antigen